MLNLKEARAAPADFDLAQATLFFKNVASPARVEICMRSQPRTGDLFRATSPLLNLRFNCDGHIFISFVFRQFTSFHSVFHSFHGLMNSINWPVSSVWVFIAQLVEHCSANVEATGSNPVEAMKNLFGAISQLLKLRFNCDGHIFISSLYFIGRFLHMRL